MGTVSGTRAGSPCYYALMAATAGVRQYEELGFAIFRNVIDPDLVEEAKGHVAWLAAKHPELRPEHLDCFLVADDPFWLRLVGDSRLLDVAEQFIGPDIALFASHYIAKPPREGLAVAWHQDGSYWPLDPMEVVTVWLSLDDARPDNGCMYVLPGTQHERLASPEELQLVEGTVLGSGIDPATIDPSKAVNIELNPGDVSVHHPNVIHGSNANTSDRWRRGLTIRYIPTTTRVTNPDHVKPFLLRGASVPGINEYGAFPRFDPARHYPFKGC